MSNKEEDPQQGNKVGKNLSKMDDLAESLNATSMVDLTATDTSTDDNADDYNDGLFDPPPPNEDCALCLTLLPNEVDQLFYHECCGKRKCSGCSLKNQAVLFWTSQKRALKDPPEPPLELTCPFCRADVNVSDEVILQRVQKRMALNDHWAFNEMAGFYEGGIYGLPKDKRKAMELYLRAVELGSAPACWNIACRYKGKGPFGHNPPAYKKYLKKAAKRGAITARRILGVVEHREGNSEVAVKHWMISAVTHTATKLRPKRNTKRLSVLTRRQRKRCQVTSGRWRRKFKIWVVTYLS